MCKNCILLIEKIFVAGVCDVFLSEISDTRMEKVESQLFDVI